MRRRANRISSKKIQYFDEAIRLYYEEGLSGPEICKIIPIHNSNFYRWLDEYDQQRKATRSRVMTKVTQKATDQKIESTSSSIEEEVVQSSGCVSSAPETEDLKEQIKLLKEQLADSQRNLLSAQIRAEAYEELINVAESKFNIKIRKKAGAKQ